MTKRPPPQPPSKQPYAFLIDPELAEALKKLKARDGAPEGESIRRALREYLTAKGVMPVTRRRAKPTKRGE